jgi:hypothetical protein
MLAREEARHKAVASASGKLVFETAFNRRLVNLVRLGSGLPLLCSDVRAIKGDGDATTFNKWN